MEAKSIPKKERNVSLDILRILSMLMVLILHYLGKSGLLNLTHVDKFNYILNYLLETLAIVVVNCYVLISGYFLVNSQFKMKKLLKLWGEVLFYSITIYFLLIVFKLQSFNTIEAVKACFPIITNQYWFVTGYFALYILSPFINKLIYAMNKEEYKRLLIILFLIFSLITFLPSDMLLDKTGGYGIIWFVCLYLLSGYIRLHVDKETIIKNRKKFVILYILSAIITTMGILTLKYIFTVLNYKDSSGKLLAYSMPLVLIESVSLFLFFNSLEIKNKIIKKITLFIAPLTFAVYLIHEHLSIRNILYFDILHARICYNNPYGIFIIIGSVIAIFICCIIIKYLRQNVLKLIEKVLYNKKIII